MSLFPGQDVRGLYPGQQMPQFQMPRNYGGGPQNFLYGWGGPQQQGVVAGGPQGPRNPWMQSQPGNMNALAQRFRGGMQQPQPMRPQMDYGSLIQQGQMPGRDETMQRFRGGRQAFMAAPRREFSPEQAAAMRQSAGGRGGAYGAARSKLGPAQGGSLRAPTRSVKPRGNTGRMY